MSCWISKSTTVPSTLSTHEGPRRLLRTYIEQGRLGVKSGAGFYDDYPRPTG